MLIYFIFFLLGLIIGSFLNVVIYRLPREESVVTPSSYCPECEHNLTVLELIPVVSFIIQGGECRECGSSISLRYPLVELSAGILFLLNGYLFLSENLIVMLAGMILISLLIVLSMIDIDHRILPDKLNFTGLALGLFLAFLRPDIQPLQAISGVLAGGGFLLILAILSKGGLGGGDIKMMAFVGSFIGPIQVMIVIFMGAFLGLIAHIPGLIAGNVSLKTSLPFGPFLAVASMIMWFTGDTLLNWYLGLLL